jgi:hypothetical protein
VVEPAAAPVSRTRPAGGYVERERLRGEDEQMMLDDKTLGQIAFEAYRDQLDGVRPWSDVREPERQVWEATAEAVASAVVSFPAADYAERH